MSGNRSGISQTQRGGGFRETSDTPQAALCSGANFSIYAVRQLIGVGTSASVYRAHDTRLRREVALKMLNTEQLAGTDGLGRFLHEARMAAAIRHPNVVSIFDVGVHDGTPYIVMELLSGEDLDVRLNAARVLREPDLIDMAVQLVNGLAAVHDAGVLHRDVSPSNVFLARGIDGSMQPKLLDFGVSKQTRDNLRLTTNGRRRWAAMPLYTAPEVLIRGDATFHSDQYSLGVLLYECATGVNPFRADTVRESIELITTGQARRIREQPIRPSRRLAAVIERAMHVDPHQRFANLRELGHALAGVSKRRARWTWGSSYPASMAGAPLPDRESQPRQTPPDRAGRWVPELGWAIGAGVIACSIVAPVLAWQFSHRQRATAALSLAAPLVPNARHVPPSVPAPASPCAGPCSAAPSPHSPRPDAVHAAPPAVVTAAVAPPELQNAAAPTPLPATLPTLERVESALAPAPAPAAPTTSAAAAPAATNVELDPAAPRGAAPDVAPPGAAAAEAIAADAGVSPSTDGGVLEPADSFARPSTAVNVPRRREERGTNGALIFD